MLSVYVKEQRPYTREELQKFLELGESSFLPFTERLRACGLLKIVSASGADGVDGQTEWEPEAFSEWEEAGQEPGVFAGWEETRQEPGAFAGWEETGQEPGAFAGWEETGQEPGVFSAWTEPGRELPSGLGGSGAGIFYRGQIRDSRRYVFTFVGILQAGNRVLKCSPKYIEEEEPIREMKQILKVLRRYHARRQTVSIYEPGGREEVYNRLAVMLYLVEDYLEHGVYTNWHPVTEVNGGGEVLWDPTINETVALMVGGRPFYPELLTEGSNSDENDYFRRLHKCIVTECSQALEDAGLTELLELEQLYETDEQLKELGDETYILYRIRRELGVQFDDRRSMILGLMDMYIAHRHMPETGSGLYLFGTNHFEQVWEAVCAQTLGNCLKKPLGMLLEREHGSYNKEQTLLDLIERPLWRYKHTGSVTRGKGRLVPDLITIYHQEGERCFAILDAKYYRIRLERGRVSGQPGIGDITKQYLYQLAYEDFIQDMGYDRVQNAFLFPGCGEEAEYLGQVELAMLASAGRKGLSHIAAVRLPAVRLYDAYLAGREEDPAGMLACVPDGVLERV